ncbi:hypothetical protein [Petrachloros mirabilis]
MKLGSESVSGFWVPRPSALEAVLARLERLSVSQQFALQRELALTTALRPYIQGRTGKIIAPLPQESELANLYLFCDFYPQDGQLTLIEQLRDVITEHIPNEERVWLDPLKHSYLDLLELTEVPKAGGALSLRSIGDGTTFDVPGGEFADRFAAGDVLLTRVIRDPDAYESGKGFLAGCGIVLSQADARVLFDQIREWERNMEMASGSLVLGEWQEFTKRYGHIVMWNFAEMRFSALVDAIVHIRYRNLDGQPYLYAVGLYDQHEYRFFVDGLSEMKEFEPLKPVSSAEGLRAAEALPPARTWIQREADGNKALTVAKLTLTSSQLIVECDTPERLDGIKHRLAAAFGFSLHFRGETLAPPARQLSVEELMSEEPLTVVVTPQEDQAVLNQFLEKAYLEWTDQGHHALGGQTPRHAAASGAMRDKVRALIDEMERNDPGVGRRGKPAFKYDILRAHVGLDESS